MSDKKENTIFLEDLHVGMEHKFGSKTMTKEEIIRFASEFDPQPFHIDEEAAKDSMFGGLVASGFHTTSVLMRMLVDEKLGKKTGSLGSPGVDNIRWLVPVRPNDTIRVESVITEVKSSRSKPDRGSVTTEYSVYNQRDEKVMTMTGYGMFLKRNPPA